MDQILAGGGGKPRETGGSTSIVLTASGGCSGRRVNQILRECREGGARPGDTGGPTSTVVGGKARSAPTASSGLTIGIGAFPGCAVACRGFQGAGFGVQILGV